MKRSTFDISMIAFILVTLLALTSVWAAQDANPIGGANTIVPGQAGATAVPSANTGSTPENAATVSDVAPSFQAPPPSFGAAPIGGQGLSAPGNGAILPPANPNNSPSGNNAGMGTVPINEGSGLTPHSLVPSATGTNP